MTEELKVEHHPDLVRNSYSKGVTNVDSSSYENYMQAALKRRTRADAIEDNTNQINNIKQDVSEMKDMLQQLLSKQNGN